MHPQTLRIYESKGLVRPKRTPGNTRLYSEADLERLRLIQRLTTELGLNLAGVETVLRLEDELTRLQARMARLERQMRDEVRARAPAVPARARPLPRPDDTTTPERARNGLQQADHQVAGGDRRRPGARAPQRQPGDLSRAPDARAPRPGAAADARRARRRARPSAARRGRGGARRTALRRRARPSSRPPRPRSRAVLDEAEKEMRELDDEFVSTEHLLLALDVVTARRAPRGALARCAARSASPRRIPRAPTRRSRSSAAT